MIISDVCLSDWLEGAKLCDIFVWSLPRVGSDCLCVKCGASVVSVALVVCQHADFTIGTILWVHVRLTFVELLHVLGSFIVPVGLVSSVGLPFGIVIAMECILACIICLICGLQIADDLTKGSQETLWLKKYH